MWLFGPDNSFGWRFATALFGTALVLLLFLVAKSLTNSTVFATVASFLLAIDGLGIVMSRSRCSTCSSRSSCCSPSGSSSSTGAKAGPPRRCISRAGRWSAPAWGPVLWNRPWLIAAGAAAGAATAVKWSGVWVLAAIGLYLVVTDALERRRLGITFWPTDAVRQGAASSSSRPGRFRRVPRVVGGVARTDGGYDRHAADANPRRGSSRGCRSLQSLWKYHATIYGSMTGMTSPHSYASPAWQWPFAGGRRRCTRRPRPTGSPAARRQRMPRHPLQHAEPAALVREHRRDRLPRLPIRPRCATGARGGARRHRGHVAPWLAYPERTIFQFYTIAIWPFLLLALTFALQHVAGAASSTASAHGGTAGRHRLPRRSPSLLSIFWYPLWSAMQVPYEFYRLHNWMQGWVYACSAYDGGLCLPGTRDLYPPELPVSAARDEIARAIAAIRSSSSRVRRGRARRRSCRRSASSSAAPRSPHAAAPHRARTIAERIAHELEVPLGGAVGYKVRFTDQVSADTKIALVTDGILLNEIHRDRLLRRYDTIIVDEAHERSLNIDFLLGYLARILPERPDLKVIITSATIDPRASRSTSRTPGAPARSSRSRAHLPGRDPLPRPGRQRRGRRRRCSRRCASSTASPTATSSSSSRVRRRSATRWMPSAACTRRTPAPPRCSRSTDASPPPSSTACSSRRPCRRARRIILATNVAETSLTVPGIRYVVDAGTPHLRYSARTKIQQLPIEAISQASAQQRSGRAGRTSDGIAIRLYAEDDFLARPEYTEPEILRTSLAAVILQMLALGFGDIEEFPFLTKPDSRGVKAAFDLFLELRAVERARREGRRLTKLGREIARLPIDPRFARMLSRRAAGVLPPCSRSSRDCRSRTSANARRPRRARAGRPPPRALRRSDERLLNLWNHLQEQQRDLGSSAFRRLCRSGVPQLRARARVVRRAPAAAPALGVRGAAAAEATADPTLVHRAILAGLLSHRHPRHAFLAKTKPGDKRRPQATYRGARGASFAIFPGSALRKASPDAVMAAELVETSRLFARTVAAIDPAWAEEPPATSRTVSSATRTGRRMPGPPSPPRR
jgi:hypothetical protein